MLVNEGMFVVGGHANINTIAVLEVTMITSVLIDDLISLQDEGGRTLVLILLWYCFRRR